ncbi:MAG TPA: stage II sporulation protein M [Pseudomonadales bacterium]|nr:stage II sporulation protein M [Pseudomonadales bacterium]
MKQLTFEQENQPFWQEFTQLCHDAEQKKRVSEDFPARYRILCHQLAIAEQRNYSPYLIDNLNNLVLRGHQLLYQKQNQFGYQILNFILREFPQIVRKNYRLVWLATILLYLPALLCALAVHYEPDFIHTLFDPGALHDIESMYDPKSDHFGKERAADSDFAMFGYYIKNNISIGFQTFGSGILAGIGSIIVLIGNGVILGGITGHLINLNYHTTFFPFVIGHGAFELTAIALSGAAGLRLGFALLMPGQLARSYALKLAGAEAVKIIYGVFIMLLCAAFLEAFWSSSTLVIVGIKYTIGALFWALVTAYFTLAGRAR